MSVIGIAIGALALAAAIVFARLVAGPTLPDRLLAFSALNTLLGLLSAGVAVVLGAAGLIGFAILQIACGFVVMVAAVKLLRLKSLQPSLERPAPVGEEAA